MTISHPYFDLYYGQLPLIISSPHSGILEDEIIPKRTTGVLGIDKKTDVIAKELFRVFSMFINQELDNDPRKPSYIISKIHRNRLDLNRKISASFEVKSDLARSAYTFFHEFLSKQIQKNIENHGYSLLIDIHGFEKEKNPFREVELILGTNNLKTLFGEKVPKRDWPKNIRGKIIKKFNQLDIPIAPGHPLRREYVLKGGYITKHYGASRIPLSQAMQIEFSDRIRLYDEKLKEKVIFNISEIIFKEIIERLD